MTPEQAQTLRFFKWAEFRHPEIVDFEAAEFLDAVRAAYGAPLILTSDGRTAPENTRIPGHSVASLHLLGRAFDIRWTFTTRSLYRLVEAVLQTARVHNVSVELELVKSATDQHVHIGLFPDVSHPSTLVLALE